MDRKIGVIQNWTKRGFGIVRVGPESSLERYFLHVSKIRSGTATPVAGMEVVFDVSDRPVQEGNLPAALRADIIVDEPAETQNTHAEMGEPSSPESGQEGK
jgi:cold shock CspA family protein